MNGAGGNSTRLMFDDDDDLNDGTAFCSIVFSATALTLVLVLFKIIYERWVTPLAEVPGHFIHSITGIPMRYYMVRGKLPEFIHTLHQQYGPVVRISPQRVSINDANIARQVLDSHSFLKTRVYDIPEGSFEPNMMSTRLPELNIERRKMISPGFSPKHLHRMEPRIVKCTVTNVQKKLDGLLQHKGIAVVQYHQWASMIMVDVIGVIGFNRELRALETGSHELSQVLGRVRDLGFITMVFPWIKCLPRFIAQRTGTLNRLVAYGREAIESHRQTPLPNEINLLQTLGSSRMTDPQIISETILHLVAGVDTTAAGITWTLALLIHNPQVLRRLVAEIRSEFPPDSDSPHISYEGCCLRLPYLAAVIAESMRVLPPVPNITPRLAPPGGVRLGGYLIPAGTWICPAIDSIHRNPAHFPKPDSFNPDRFLAPGPEQQCLVAFSAGVRACIGRNLALLVMNLVLANLLRNYDLQAPGSAKPESNPTATVDLDDKATTGSVPDIPRRTQATTTPTNPDRDCLVLVSLPAQA